MRKKKRTAELKRDETGMWVVEFPELPGCVTQARTIEQAERRAREALAVFLDIEDEDSLKIDFSIDLPPAVQSTVNTAIEARAKAESEQAHASKASRKAARALAKRGLSARDVGTLLGISRQRANLLMSMATKS